MRVAFVISCTAGELPGARAAAAAIRRPHPERDVVLCLADRLADDINAGGVFAAVLDLEAIAGGDWAQLAFRYAADELVAKVRPLALMRALDLGYDRVVHLSLHSADTLPIDRAFAALDGGVSSVVGVADGPGKDIEILALSGNPSVDGALKQWGRSVMRPYLLTEVERQGFEMPAWLDFWAAHCPDVELLKAEDHPQPVPGAEAFPADRDDLTRRNDFGHFDNGTPIPDVARRLFREQLEPFAGNPFSRLPGILCEPSPDVRPNPNGIIGRLAFHLWQSRPDLQSAFPLEAEAQLGLALWVASTPEEQGGLPAYFATSTRRQVDGLRSDRSLFGIAAWLRYRAGWTLSNRAPRVFRLLARDNRAGAGRWMRRAGWPTNSSAVPRDQTGKAGAAAAIANSRQPKLALTLIGDPFVENGIGEALRSLARSVASASIPSSVHTFPDRIGVRAEDRSVEALVSMQEHGAVNLFCVNADTLPATLSRLGVLPTKDRRNILRPFWELGVLPSQWNSSLEQMDEVWAPTEFVRAAFATAVQRPVVHVPLAVTLPLVRDADRGAFGLPAEDFLFLFAFNSASHTTRKNPLAVVEAFRLAFERSEVGVGLVIKTMGRGPAHDAIIEALNEQARGDGRIRIVDGTFARHEAAGLTAACDAFVSLHRSEGFGLGIAEAMLLGKPVIATNYSGNTDFLNARTGFPVSYRLIGVREEDYPYYVPGQVWADPDVEEAATIMRSVFSGQTRAKAIGQAARSHMLLHHSPAAVGQIVRNRLVELGVLAAEAA